MTTSILNLISMHQSILIYESCSALIFLSDIHKHSNTQTDVIYLDSAKAFDKSTPRWTIFLKLRFNALLETLSQYY